MKIYFEIIKENRVVIEYRNIKIYDNKMTNGMGYIHISNFLNYPDLSKIIKRCWVDTDIYTRHDANSSTDINEFLMWYKLNYFVDTEILEKYDSLL